MRELLQHFPFLRRLLIGDRTSISSLYSGTVKDAQAQARQALRTQSSGPNPIQEFLRMTERVPVKRKITVGGKRIHGRRVHARLGYVETAHLKHFGLAPPDSKIQRHSVFAIFHKGRPLFSRVVDVKELDHIDEATGLKPYPDSESYRIDVGTRIRHLMSLLK